VQGNNNWDYDIHRAMSHYMNRKIIECLHDENLGFTELLNKVGDDGNHGKFGYHLRTLSKFVELEPTTKKYRLTDRGELLANLIQDFRFMTSRRKEASRYAERLTIGDHAVALYGNESFKRQISFPFLNAGLSRGEAAVFFVSENKLDSEIREIQKYGIDLDSLPNGAFTITSGVEWYLGKGGAKNEKTFLSNLQMLIQEKKKAGFTGVHVAGEVTDFINAGLGEELLKYDELLGRHLVLDVCGLCLYDKNMLEERYIARVLNCHGHIISKDLLGKTVA
jgi:hypothetical protein